LENIDYLHDTYEYKNMDAWMEEYDSGERWKYLHDNETGNKWEGVLNYSLQDALEIADGDDISIRIPEGYHSFRDVKNYGFSRYSIPVHQVENDVIPCSWVLGSDTITIWVDLKETNRAINDKQRLTLRATSDKTAQGVKEYLFVAEHINVEMIPDSIYSANFHGYLFEK